MRFFNRSFLPLFISLSVATPSFAYQEETDDIAEKINKRQLSKAEQKLAEDTILSQQESSFEGLQSIADLQEEVIQENLPTANEAVLSSKSNVLELTQSDISELQSSPDFKQFQLEFADAIGMSASPEELAKMEKKQNAEKYGEDIDVYVAISTSMPESSIESLINELSYEHSDKNVIVALRGTEKGQFSRMSFNLNSMIPSDTNGQFDIVIDPTIFDSLEITQVPMFVIKTDKGWRKVLGDIPLSQAFYHSKKDYDLFEAAGPVYDIKEPNQIAVIKEQLKDLDTDELVNNSKQKIRSGQEANVILDLAYQDDEYLIDPTISIKKDLVFEGVLFAPAGTTINPLKTLPLKGQFAFVDLSIPSHIEQLRKWKLTHSSLRVMTTKILEESKQADLVKEFGFISQINELMVTRFGLTHIPSIAFQEDLSVRVEVVNVETPYEVLK